MKRVPSYLFALCCVVVVYSCGDKDAADIENESTEIKIQKAITSANTGCKSTNPQQSLAWLKEIVIKAEEDKRTKRYSGNYMGKILLTAYQNQPVFYTRMALGSGGVYAHLYNCNGETIAINEADVTAFSQDAQQGRLIYSNVP